MKIIPCKDRAGYDVNVKGVKVFVSDFEIWDRLSSSASEEALKAMIISIAEKKAKEKL